MLILYQSNRYGGINIEVLLAIHPPSYPLWFDDALQWDTCSSYYQVTTFSLFFPPSLLHHLALHSPYVSSLYHTYSFLLSSLLFFFSPLCTVPLYSNILIINKGINLISSLQSVNTSISCSKHRYSGTSYVPLLLLSPSSLLSSLFSLIPGLISFASLLFFFFFSVY